MTALQLVPLSPAEQIAALEAVIPGVRFHPATVALWAWDEPRERRSYLARLRAMAREVTYRIEFTAVPATPEQVQAAEDSLIAALAALLGAHPPPAER